MKKLGAIMLSVIIVLVTIQNTLLFTSFKLNQDFISKFLCLEKDKVVNTCKGACHLKDVLDQANNSDLETPLPNLVENETELFYFNCKPNLKTLIQDMSSEKTPELNDAILYFEWINESFHPPQALV